MCFLYLQRNVNFCSDFANVASEMPYFWPSSSTNRDQLHFVICVHGLDGKIFLYVIKCYGDESAGIISDGV